MSKRITTITQDAAIRQVGERKLRAAESRSSKIDLSSDASRTVYLDSCAEVATHFTSSGYRYAKSGPHLSKRAGSNTLKISFSSDRNNIRGEFVGLNVAALVTSPKLKKWRKRHRNNDFSSDQVAGGYLFLLDPGVVTMDWNLANSRSRPEVVSDIAEAIRSLAIPFFSKFESPEKISTYWAADALPCFRILSVVEYLLCFSTKQDAEAAVRAYFLRFPKAREEHFRCLEEYRASGLPEHALYGYGDQTAYAALNYSLDI